MSGKVVRLRISSAAHLGAPQWCGGLGGFRCGLGIIGWRQSSKDCQSTGVGIILNLRVERERIGIVLCCRVHMGQVFTIHLLYSDKWGDGVSFVESLPRP